MLFLYYSRREGLYEGFDKGGKLRVRNFTNHIISFYHPLTRDFNFDDEEMDKYKEWDKDNSLKIEDELKQRLEEYFKYNNYKKLYDERKNGKFQLQEPIE